MKSIDFKSFYLHAVLVVLACALLTSVAGINIAILLLLFSTPWFWRSFIFEPRQKKVTIQFFFCIAAIAIATVNFCFGIKKSKILKRKS